MKLTEYVNKIMKDKGLSTYEVSRRSKSRGRKGVSSSYVNLICQEGEMTNLTVDRLQSLAVGLGVSEDEIFMIARGKLLKLEPDVMRESARIAEIYAELSPLERQRFKIMADSFLLTIKGENEIVKSKPEKTRNHK